MAQRQLLTVATLLSLLGSVPGVHAEPWFKSGRLLATTGVNQVEGAGGGGLVPWAVITGYGTRDAIGGNVHGTVVRTGNYMLSTVGAAAGLYDRVELSYARQWFDARAFPDLLRSTAQRK